MSKDFIYKNSIENLSRILKEEKAKNILVFTSKKSFNGFKSIIELQLKGFDLTYYSDFLNNPKADEVQTAVGKLGKNFDIIVAIGGGSVIDFAKLFRFSIDNDISVEAFFQTKPTVQQKTKLIAIPTTAGTGAETTQFAVVYVNGVKHSLEDKAVLPDYAIVDSQFAENVPKYIKACCALDAYCQAIESFWAVDSTNESIEFAIKSIELCRDYLEKYVNFKNSEYAEKMALASNLSGKAINISKTTASHALSYAITADYGLPHGHAVALSIANLMEFNSVIDENSNQDKRGVKFVKTQMETLYKLIGVTNSVEYFLRLFNNIEIEYNLKKLGINDVQSVIKKVDLQRLGNNPRRMDFESLNNIFIC